MLGSVVGHYRITEKLGQGGMGVVYKAYDIRLERAVALKLLPAERIEDPHRRQRLLQEARAAAALSHPNIVHIYEIAGAECGDYIAMEFVVGTTLADRIPPGGISASQALKIAIQIADALAAAHAAGIVHRDLKPSNIMLTPSGQVKVLDFGLAKFTQGIAGEDEPTRTLAHTEEGVAVGTAAYMSPEQAEARRVDARSDIFSFGCIIYEMASGRRAFGGESRLATLSAIVSEAPQPVPASVPAGIRGVVQRCLMKDPADRYQKAEEVRAALEILRDTSSETPPARVAARRPRWRVWVPIAAILMAGAAALVWHRTSRPPQPVRQRLISVFPGSHRSPSFSPDGSMLAFVSDAGGVPQIWVKSLAQGDPIQITRGDLPASNPSWSPKSDQIVFTQRSQGLWSVPPLGGPAHLILEYGRNASFSSDGDRLVYERGSEIWTAAADGSNSRKVAGVPELYYTTDRLPTFSPDGRSIVFFHPELGPNGDLWVIPAAGGEPRRLTFDMRAAGHPIWTPDGRWIVYSSQRRGSSTLWRIAAAGGEPQPLTSGAGEDLEPTISANARELAYTNVRNSWALVLLDPENGAQQQVLERRREILFPMFSPSGDRIAFFYNNVGDTHIYTVAADGTDVRQVTSGAGEIDSQPRWSADGGFLYFYRQWPVKSFRKVPAAAGGPSVEVAPWSWQTQNGAREDPSGRFLCYTLQSRGKPTATVIHELATGRERFLAEGLLLPRWSPDGKTIAGGTVTGGSAGILKLCPVSGEACAALTKGFYPAWTADGQALYFFRAGAARNAPDLWRLDIATHAEKKVITLGPFRYIDRHFDVSRDGRIVSAPFREGRYELWLADLE